MSEGHGVGVNGEPDDFGARYDRMVEGGGTSWVIKVLVGIAVVLIAAGAIWSLLPLPL
jgi:hypothetical protein